MHKRKLKVKYFLLYYDWQTFRISIVVTYLKSCPEVFKVTYLKILVKYFWENDESLMKL